MLPVKRTERAKERRVCFMTRNVYSRKGAQVPLGPQSPLGQDCWLAASEPGSRRARVDSASGRAAESDMPAQVWASVTLRLGPSRRATRELLSVGAPPPPTAEARRHGAGRPGRSDAACPRAVRRCRHVPCGAAAPGGGGCAAPATAKGRSLRSKATLRRRRPPRPPLLLPGGGSRHRQGPLWPRPPHPARAGRRRLGCAGEGEVGRARRAGRGLWERSRSRLLRCSFQP